MDWQSASLHYPGMAKATLQVSIDPGFRWVHFDDIEPWILNPRLNAPAIPKVAASLRRFGAVAPLVVWTEKGRLVAGHTRLAALKAILEVEPDFIPKGAPPGTKPGMLPVRFHAFGSEQEADAYAIADNRLNEIAQWDKAALDAILLTLDPVDIGVTGFDLPAVPLDPVLVPPPAPETTPTPASDPKPSESVPAYSLVFQDGAALAEFEDVVRSLRKAYPGDTISARLLMHLRAFPVPHERV